MCSVVIIIPATPRRSPILALPASSSPPCCFPILVLLPSSSFPGTVWCSRRPAVIPSCWGQRREGGGEDNNKEGGTTTTTPPPQRPHDHSTPNHCKQSSPLVSCPPSGCFPCPRSHLPVPSPCSLSPPCKQLLAVVVGGAVVVWLSRWWCGGGPPSSSLSSPPPSRCCPLSLLPLSTLRAVARGSGLRCSGGGWWWWWWLPVLPSPRPPVPSSPHRPVPLSPRLPATQLLPVSTPRAVACGRGLGCRWWWSRDRKSVV